MTLAISSITSFANGDGLTPTLLNTKLLNPLLTDLGDVGLSLRPVVNLLPTMSVTEIQAVFDGGGRITAGPGVYTIDGQTVTRSIHFEGAGYDTILRVRSGSTQIPILIQDSNVTAEIPYVYFGHFVLDGNRSGLLDAGLIQCNNAVGWFEKIWVKNAGTPGQAPPAGVGGIVVSAGALGAAGSQVVIQDCIGEACTKAPFNITTQSINCLITRNIARNNTGNGETPGIQLNGGFNGQVVFNSAYSNEGNGIVVGCPLEGQTSRHGVVAFNKSYLNGQGASTGHGIAVLNSFTDKFGHLKILYNSCYSNGVNFASDGINVANYNDILIQGNTCYGNKIAGINASHSSNIDILDNDVTHNDALGATIGGILVYDLTRFSIERNRSFDDHGTPTQDFGLTFYSGGTCNDGVVRHNRFHPTVVGAIQYVQFPTNTQIDLPVSEGTSYGVTQVAGLVSGITTVKGNYTITVNDQVVSVNSSSTCTVTLPAASTVTGQVFDVHRMGTQTVVITATSGSSLNASANTTLLTQYQSMTFQSFGSGYLVK